MGSEMSRIAEAGRLVFCANISVHLQNQREIFKGRRQKVVKAYPPSPTAGRFEGRRECRSGEGEMWEWDQIFLNLDVILRNHQNARFPEVRRGRQAF